MAICLGVASQLIVKWKMSAFSFNDYETWQEKFMLAFSMLVNPYIIIAIKKPMLRIAPLLKGRSSA